VSCKLEAMFNLRKEFIERLEKEIPGSYPAIPVDLRSKPGQKLCRDLALKGVEEMFEALQHLKNWKDHKLTETPEVDGDEYLEEIVDAFNYFFSLIIASGFTHEDLYNAYIKKDKKIHERLTNKY
jgi:hypothetical protein